MKQLGFLILFFLCAFGCTVAQQCPECDADYQKQKQTFAEKYVDHFPDKIVYPVYQLITNEDTDKNDIGLILYLHNVSDQELKEKEAYCKRKSQAVYHSDDSCLMVINSFETKETLDNRYDITDVDTNLLNEMAKCPSYPIPSFLDGKIMNQSAVKLSPDFDIYVLEAKSGVFEKEFQEKKDIQMPGNWSNGYSKGIAISKEKKIIVYWFVMW